MEHILFFPFWRKFKTCAPSVSLLIFCQLLLKKSGIWISFSWTLLDGVRVVLSCGATRCVVGAETLLRDGTL